MRTSQLTTALFFALFVSMANAEDMSFLLHTTPKERAASQTRFMKTKLNLSPDELAKVQAINQQYAEKIEPVLKGSSFFLIKKHDIEAIQQDKDDSLKSILTPDQFKIYSNSKDELEQAMEQDLKQ